MTDNQAHARNTDPETSHMAADGVDVGRTKRLILDALRVLRDKSSEPVKARTLALIIQIDGNNVSDSGVRSRLAELIRDGLVEVADMKGVTPSGRKCRRYRLADQD